MQEFGRSNLAELRVAQGLSQERLARIVDVSTSTIRRAEKGHVPNGAVLVRIAQALDTSVEALLGERVA